MVLEEFSAGRLEFNLSLNLLHLVFIGVIGWTSAVCCTRINHDSVSGRTSFQSKDPHWTVEFIIRDVRRDSELPKRRGAGSRSALLLLSSVLTDSSQQVKWSDCSAQASTCVPHHPSSSCSRLSRGRSGVTVETLLVPCWSFRLGIGLVLVVFDHRLPLTILGLTVFGLPVLDLPFPPLPFEHGDVQLAQCHCHCKSWQRPTPQ